METTVKSRLYYHLEEIEDGLYIAHIYQKISESEPYSLNRAIGIMRENYPSAKPIPPQHREPEKKPVTEEEAFAQMQKGLMRDTEKLLARKLELEREMVQKDKDFHAEMNRIGSEIDEINKRLAEIS